MWWKVNLLRQFNDWCMIVIWKGIDNILFETSILNMH